VKAKLISQVLRGDYNQRVIEDVDTKVLTYSEIKAIATGDTRFLKRAKLEGEVSRLEALKRNYDDQRRRLNQDVHKNLPNTIDWLRKLIVQIEKDITALESYPAPIFECDGVKYDISNPEERKLAAQAIPRNLFGCKIGDVLGTCNGMSVVIVEQANTFFRAEKTVVLQGNAVHRLDNHVVSTGRTLIELCDRIIYEIPKSLETKKDRLKSNEMALKAATDMLSEPFEHEETLAELKKEFMEITESLAS
jgi:hypothetical protein